MSLAEINTLYYATELINRFGGCTLDSNETVTRITRGYPHTRFGSDNPFYKEQIANRTNATTRFSRTGYQLERAIPGSIRLSGACSIKDKPDHYREYVGIGHSLPTTLPMAQNLAILTNEALANFVSKAVQVQRQISGGVFLGELKETLKLIRNPAASLRTLMRLYLEDLQRRRRRGFRSVKAAEKHLAGAWLEASFGWMPLISDTESGAIALARLLNDKSRTRQISARSEADPTSSQSFSTSGYVGMTTRTLRTNTLQASTLIKGAVSAKASGPTLEHARDLFGFNTRDFVPTVWNLLPWSFVADYFLNIGDILEATFFDTSTVSWISQTQRLRTECLSTTVLSGVSPGWSAQGSFLGQTLLSRQHTLRTRPDSLVPALTVTAPGLSTKWINLAALYSQHRRLIPFWK